MNEIQKLSQAEKWLAEAKTLNDLKQIHDIARAAEAYSKAHQLGIAAENHAREIKLVAGYRIAELKPATPPKESGAMGAASGKLGGRGKKAKHKKTGISHKEIPLLPPKKMAEFRKLQKTMEEPELRKRCKKLTEWRYLGREPRRIWKVPALGFL